MHHLLQNKLLTVQVALPATEYLGTRYDWTGMLTRVTYKGHLMTSAERPSLSAKDGIGQGFCNEFGIKAPVGYDEIQAGEWFHKIGIGLLQRDKGPYNFLRNYPVRSAKFTTELDLEKVHISCEGPLENGYAYKLDKTFHLLEDGFEILYQLKNTGTKSIITNEYNHNFIAINGSTTGSNYQIKFPFQLDESVLDERINPEALVQFGADQIGFSGAPEKDFFFSDLSGGKVQTAHWELSCTTSRLVISETGDFPSKAFHLWGSGHVISPEMYIDINLLPGATQRWKRTYAFNSLP